MLNHTLNITHDDASRNAPGFGSIRELSQQPNKGKEPCTTSKTKSRHTFKIT